MTEKYIREHWFPICKPGNLIKKTESGKKTLFFIATSEAHFYSSIIDDRIRIELTGIWISHPIGLSENKILTCEQRNNSTRILFGFSNKMKLELSNKDEMIRTVKEEYESEIKNMREEIRTLKENIKLFKRELRNIDATMSDRYQQALASNTK